MKFVFLLLIASSFCFVAQADSVKCGTSSYYAFSKCSKSKKKRVLKSLFNKDISQALSFVELLEEELSLTFGKDVRQVKEVITDSKNYLAKTLIKKRNGVILSSLNAYQQESFIVFLSDCKISNKCNSLKANLVIDELLIQSIQFEKLAAEVKDAKSI